MLCHGLKRGALPIPPHAVIFPDNMTAAHLVLAASNPLVAMSVSDAWLAAIEHKTRHVTGIRL